MYARAGSVLSSQIEQQGGGWGGRQGYSLWPCVLGTYVVSVCLLEGGEQKQKNEVGTV